MKFVQLALGSVTVALAVAGCTGGNQSTPSGPSASSSTTTTTTTTTTTVTTTTTTPPSTTTTTTTTTSASKTAISSVTVGAVGTFCMDKVGPDSYQLEPDSSCSRGANFELEWHARGENGDVKSDDCTVVIDVTGPNGLNERRRSSNCTGGSRGYDNAVYIKHVAGDYVVAISITPPDGGAPVTATKTITILPNRG
ncbi:hypothetical protein [Mycobacterium sp. HM-7]